MSKAFSREVLRGAGLTVAPGVALDAHGWRTDRGGILERIAAFGADGVVVKPDHGGSSVATSIVRAAADVPAAIERALETDDGVVVEARIAGVEATCGVLGLARSGLRALTPVEIVPKDGRFFDYEEKYSATGAAEHCPPVSLGEETCTRIQSAAVRAFRAAGCAGYARIDFMIPPCGSGDGVPVVLEINTLPGMTDRSLLPLAAKQAGMGFRDLCLEILGLALERGRA
jgi:D-alanine-D-alanine ligase